MVRFLCVVLMTTTLAASSLVQAADNAALNGNYRVMLLNNGQMVDLWLVKIGEKDKKAAIELVGSLDQLKAQAVEKFKIEGDLVSFEMETKRGEFSFEGKIPKEKGQPIKGSLSLNHRASPAELRATKVTKFDTLELSKEDFDGAKGAEIFALGELLTKEGIDKNADAKDIREWVNKTVDAAGSHGPTWQRDMAVRLGNLLQEKHPAIALEVARKAEKTLRDSDEAATQIRVVKLLISAMKKENKEADVKALDARLEKLEAKADEEYIKNTPTFKVDVYGGRKDDTNKVALVELFTGAECPPCVACDVAFDALEKAFRPSEVVFLQYHLNIPRPDPLTAPASNDRFEYYRGRGTPTFAINGNVENMSGGHLGAAKERYDALRKVIDPQIDKKTDVNIKATAKRKDEKVEIKVDVDGVEKPGEKIRLRIVLVEEAVHYVGGNAIRVHHSVVRAMPGGAKGIEIKEKTLKQTETVDLKSLREDLHKYLNEVAKEDAFPNDKRPMDFKKLSVVCFVQDDENKAVLQAVQVNVNDE